MTCDYPECFVFPTLTSAGVQIAEQKTDIEIKKILGAGIVQQLTILTSGIIKNVDENVVSSRQTFERLRAALKKVHPTKKFIEFPNTNFRIINVVVENQTNEKLGSGSI